jgi:hypothetical protein
MKTVDITPGDAIALARDNDLKVPELEALGFRIVAGSQVEAAEVAEIEVNEKLVAGVKALLKKAHPPSRGSGLTKDGRTIRTLTPYDGIGPYTVVIYAPKS